MSRRHFYRVVGAFFCLISACFGETVYFLVAETTPAHGDSYVLPLTESADIAHARDLIAYGPSAGQPIVVAKIACGPDCINRNYLASSKPTWSWRVTDFNNFADSTPENLNGWPAYVNSNCLGWLTNRGSYIGFWDYTVVEELGTDPEHWLRDFDDDSDVDFFDYVPVGDNWDYGCAAPDWCGGTDLDQSGKVDYNDLSIFAEAWLSPFASPAAPDPLWFDCWNGTLWPYSYQCFGDADGTKTPLTGYRIYTNDLAIINAVLYSKCGWPCYYPNEGYNPCADFNRDYRIYDDDMAILQANWAKKDSNFPVTCPTAGSECTLTYSGE